MKNLKLCEICDVRDGTHDSPSYYSEGYPFITTKNIVNGSIDFSTASLICEKDYQHFDKRSHVDDGDILMPMIGTIGGAVLVKKDRDFAIKNVALIKKKNENIDFDFLLNVLNSNRMKSFFEQYKTGGTQKFISLTFIRNLPIPDISLEEQKEIATNLKKIQSAIDNKKQQLSLLDEAVKSEFVEMFGDPIFNSKNFPTKKVIDVVTMQRGYDLPIQDRDCTGKIPVFGSNGILGNHNLAKMDKGIITGRSGTIGEVYMCETPFWPLNTTLFSKDTHGNNICYLKFLLEFFDLKRFKSGVGVPTLNRNEFHDEQIIDVPLELQNQFASFVQQIDKSKFVVKQQIADLQELLDSKMQEYFS